MVKGWNAFAVIAVTMVACALCALIGLSGIGVLFLVINLLSLGAEALVLRHTHPAVLRRSLDAVNTWDRSMVALMVLGAVASAALSAYDANVLKASPLPVWTFILGVVLMMSGFLVAGQSAMAKAPHAADKYGEEAGECHERGSYETVRHPFMLSALLGGLSIPLFLGSGLGFAPLALFLVALLVRTAREDDWRFNEYEWYYDYMKEVPYRLIPFIW